MSEAWIPATSFIRASAAGRPFLQGWRCDSCAAPYLAERLACARCGSTGGFASFVAATRGTIHTYTVVYRSYPNVAVPFVSVIVDLDDGLTLKGNLSGVRADPAAVVVGTRVRLYFAPALGARSADGTPYLAYFFEPCESSRE